MFYQRHSISLAVNASGALTDYTPVVSGRVLAVRYVAGDLDTGTDITITGETTGVAILTITDAGTSNLTWFPRHQVHGPTGTALTYNGTQTVNEAPVVVNERIKVVVAQGGTSKTGTLYFLLA